MPFQRSAGPRGRLLVPDALRRADSDGKVDSGGPEEARGPQLPPGVPGGGEGARRVQEGEGAALRGRAASASQGQLQFAGQALEGSVTSAATCK